MPRKLRVAKERRTADEAEIRRVLLKDWTHDYLNWVPDLGREACEAYWRAHRTELIAEFKHGARADLLDACGGKPLGFHLFG
jgi:hypothetical protein